MRAESAVERGSDAPARPPILGSLERGKYSNLVIGFEMQLDPACTFADESRAIEWSTRFSARLNLALRCGENLLIFSSPPLHSDETVDLKRDAKPSLEGAMAGGGFKKRGGWQRQTVDGTEVLVQELVRHGDSGPELGFYHAFMIGRRYVSILAIGPEANCKEIGSSFATLKIASRPAP